MKPKRSIRISQGMTTFGVGAIYGLGEESFINTDIKKWIASPDQKVEIKFPRLAKKLNVEKFMYPKPASGYGHHHAKLKFMRFPSWLFCPICRSMKNIDLGEAIQLNGEIPTCYNKKCKGHDKKNMLPMRFIIACENGHIDDFPWQHWAHTHTNVSERGNCKDNNNLFFETKLDAGASYGALYVKCKTCGSGRSLAGLEEKGALKGVGVKCRGKQPWQAHTDVECECDETPVMKQRNASNIYQPVIVSAIDIDAPSTNFKDDDSQLLEDVVQEHSLYTACVRTYESGGITPAFKELIKIVSNDINRNQDEIILIFTGKEEEEVASKAPESIYALKLSLQTEEWPSFFVNIVSEKFINKVETEDGPNNLPNDLSILLNFFDNISLVKKLKEVRVFKGFGRLKFDPGKIISPSLDKYTNWLPAVEVFGEGVFISVDKNKVDNWYKKNKENIDKKIRSVQDSYESNELEEQFGLFSAKFVMLHTLSHLLIRQLAFESGYNSSSLRESVYFSDEYNMSGIFIYTADSDSEGSLGGLVRQGELDRLLPAILLSLKKARWCSSDPVCSESNKGQGERGLNQGACHACALISETSCSHYNSLLSRSLLIDKEIGFFREVILEN